MRHEVDGNARLRMYRMAHLGTDMGVAHDLAWIDPFVGNFGPDWPEV